MTDEPSFVTLRAKASAREVKYHVAVPDVAATTYVLWVHYAIRLTLISPLISWQALIYYTYTAQVNFAPLKSAGIVERRAALEQHIMQHPDLPLPCSPKSLYRLADIVRHACIYSMPRSTIEFYLIAGWVAEAQSLGGNPAQ